MVKYTLIQSGFILVIGLIINACADQQNSVDAGESDNGSTSSDADSDSDGDADTDGDGDADTDGDGDADSDGDGDADTDGDGDADTDGDGDADSDSDKETDAPLSTDSFSDSDTVSTDDTHTQTGDTGTAVDTGVDTEMVPDSGLIPDSGTVRDTATYEVPDAGDAGMDSDTETDTIGNPCLHDDVCGVGGVCVATGNTLTAYYCECMDKYELKDPENQHSRCREIPCYDQIGTEGCALNAHCGGELWSSTCVCDEGHLGDPVADGCTICDESAGYLVQDGECAPLPGPLPGDLVITEVMIQPEGVQPGDGQYVEFFNTSTDIVNLSTLSAPGGGLYILINNEYFEVPSTPAILMYPHEYFVVARNADPETNGGIVVDLEYPSMPVLTTDSGHVELDVVDGALLGDELHWDNTFPHEAGHSLSLSPDILTSSDPQDQNDLSSAWCSTQSTTFGSGDYGTPGEENDPCPTI